MLFKPLAGLGNGMRVFKPRAARWVSSLPFETWNCGKGDHLTATVLLIGKLYEIAR